MIKTRYPAEYDYDSQKEYEKACEAYEYAESQAEDEAVERWAERNER